jgi:hypothetical protein
MLLEVRDTMGVTPKAFDSMVELDERQNYYYDIFTEVSQGRGSGMNGPLPITFESMLAYCVLYEIDDIEQRALVVKHIRSLDNEYLAFAAKQRESASSDKTS